MTSVPSPDKKLFPVAQILYSGIWLVFPPCAAGWLLVRLVNCGLARSGIGNLEGIILGLGTSTVMALTVGAASAVRHLVSP